MMSHSDSTDSLKLLTTEQVADVLSVSRSTVRRLAARGELRRIRISQLVRFDASDLMTLVENGRVEERSRRHLTRALDQRDEIGRARSEGVRPPR
jgi:excisionase family DNA binding protein